MSFIVYGVTKTVTDKLAESAFIRKGDSWEQHKERVFRRRRSLPLSAEFSAPQFAKEFIELIKKSGVQHKKLKD